MEKSNNKTGSSYPYPELFKDGSRDKIKLHGESNIVVFVSAEAEKFVITE